MDPSEFVDMVRQEIKVRSCCTMILSKKKQIEFRKWFIYQGKYHFAWSREHSLKHYEKIRTVLNWK